ncbi:hypothetical protein OXX59_009028, partial [Metschnikowia pulcherrima]
LAVASSTQRQGASLGELALPSAAVQSISKRGATSPALVLSLVAVPRTQQSDVILVLLELSSEAEWSTQLSSVLTLDLSQLELAAMVAPPSQTHAASGLSSELVAEVMSPQ